MTRSLLLFVAFDGGIDGGRIHLFGRPTVRQGLRVVRDDQAMPTTWAELVMFRMEHPETTWAEEQRALLAKEFTERVQRPGAKGVATDMAKQLDITVSRFNELKRKASQQGKRISARQRAA